MARRAQDVYTEWRGGTCRVKWWSGDYHDDGRKRFESKGGFTDEDEAFQYGQDKLYEIRHGTGISNRDGATLMTEWIDDWFAATDHAYTTYKSYKAIINRHIKPYFRGKTVAEIDVIAYRAFRKHIHKKLPSPGSAKNVMTVLGMILDDAVPRLIRVSPVERTRQRGRYVKKTQRERKRDMDIGAVGRLARNAEAVFGYPGHVMIWTMAMTGMRPGELFGLRREYCYPNWPAADPRPDEDEEERYAEDAARYGAGEDRMPAIRVQQQVQQEKGTIALVPPKYFSYRTLVVPPFLADMLEKLLASHGNEWVFPGIEGGCLASTSFSVNYWPAISQGADARVAKRGNKYPARPAIPAVPDFAGKRIYLLRHGHKAWLDEDGHSRFAVESRMGHEVPGVEGTYSSVTVAMERAIMKALQERWERFQEQADAS
ncbi:tyrosine-type recombinase/integrase [Streptomyces sp. NPDC050534]|uniref:tyrosine-type recombinase/integrase n=1 Tax=Streptomyces sp. NPDC050534 TaxID=3365625 RepID=UPI0037A80155